MKAKIGEWVEADEAHASRKRNELTPYRRAKEGAAFREFQSRQRRPAQPVCVQHDPGPMPTIYMARTGLETGNTPWGATKYCEGLWPDYCCGSGLKSALLGSDLDQRESVLFLPSESSGKPLKSLKEVHGPPEPSGTRLLFQVSQNGVLGASWLAGWMMFVSST